MVDVSQISAVIASLNAAKDIASAMIGLRDGKLIDGKVGEFNDVLINAQRAIFEVNQERTTLIEAVRTLKEELLKLETWNVEKERYELNELKPGVLAYALKTSVTGGEPSHLLCPNCYAQAHKSILQGQNNTYKGWETKKCHRCSLELRYFRSELPAAPLPQLPKRRTSDWMG